MKKKRVAIIGGGTAGATAAWALKDVCDVSLLEKENELGGHAFSKTVHIDGHKVEADLGVELFTEKLSPNLCALYKRFGLNSYVAPLSFCAIFGSHSGYWSNRGSGDFLWDEIRKECDRFQLDMHSVLQFGGSKYKGVSLGEFVVTHNYSESFIRKGLLPLLTTFSGCKAPSLDYSLTYVALAFNAGLLAFYNAPYWRKLEGGITQYLALINEEIKSHVELGVTVNSVSRHKTGIRVTYNKTSHKDFDEVVFATHANIALKLLQNPTNQEKTLLGGFEYVDVESVFHSDAKVLASNFQHKCYCEYRSFDSLHERVFNAYT